MCKLKSMIVLKDRIYCPDHDHHQQMLEELGIEDNYLGASKTFVRVELSPANNDVTIPVDEWQINVDQDITPEWFDVGEYRERIYETVKAWAAGHIHTSGVVKIDAGIHWACGSATVKACGSATVKACDSATVEACGSATVEAYDSATVEACGSATVEAYDSATVKAYESATVKAYDSATVKAYDSATVKACDSATVEACGSATVFDPVYWVLRVAPVLSDNATYKCNHTKTIYQAGDGWTFVKAENPAE